jgi:hypothetical protein
MRLPVVFIRRRFFTAFAGEPVFRGGRAGQQTKGKILAEHDEKTQVSAGIPVALGSAVRVIFAAWLVLAILLLGLGRLTTVGDREPAPKRLTAQR